ncbi:MAG: hypothetical protein QNI84_09295 [Henriciella sp.]|nr:hypothetical protein [Henriciella sp.]
MRLFIAALAISLLTAPALAQDDTTPPPPCDTPEYHQFDFWIGDWEVSSPDGAAQGRNVITAEESGCLLVERWVSTAGNTGQSYNFYNPVTETWRQIWVSTGAIIDYEGGLTDTGSMKLEGTITYPGSGVTAPFTGEWTPNEDGSVTQHFEQYDAEKDAWAAWFTGIYRRAESDQL